MNQTAMWAIGIVITIIFSIFMTLATVILRAIWSRVGELSKKIDTLSASFSTNEVQQARYEEKIKMAETASKENKEIALDAKSKAQAAHQRQDRCRQCNGSKMTKVASG